MTVGFIIFLLLAVAVGSILYGMSKSEAEDSSDRAQIAANNARVARSAQEEDLAIKDKELNPTRIETEKAKLETEKKESLARGAAADEAKEHHVDTDTYLFFRRGEAQLEAQKELIKLQTDERIREQKETDTNTIQAGDMSARLKHKREEELKGDSDEE